MTPARGVTAALALAALAVSAYAPGLFHPFVYDDHGAIVENRFWSEPDAWRRVLTLQTVSDPRVLDGQRPALLLSILADRALGAREPWRFRITNIALHAGCSILLLAWVRGLLRRRGDPQATARAWITAMLFVLHPLATEVVQVPSYREDAIALFGMFAALASGAIRLTAIRIPLMLACIWLAAAAKEGAAAIPFLAVATWWIFHRERAFPKTRLVEFGLMLALVIGWFAFAYSSRPAQALGGAWNGLSLRPPENLWTAPLLFLRYLALLAVPWPLCADRVVNPVTSPASAEFLLPALASLGYAASVLALRHRAPLAALGLSWIAVCFGPVSNLIPLFNPFADRYAYAMIPGFAMAVAALPIKRCSVRWAWITLAIAYFALIQIRLPDWGSDEALWRATLRAEPRSARAHVGLGLAALERGDSESATRWFEKADQLNPQDVTALINLAILDGRRGDLDSAAARLEEAVRRRPDKPEAWANLAVARELQGRRDEALDAAEKARALDPLRRY